MPFVQSWAWCPRAVRKKKHKIGSPYEMKRIGYSVDGNVFSIEIRGSEAWQTFMERMAALAREGHEIFLWDEDVASTVSTTKETVTYTTPNVKEATNWCEAMINEGYKVTMVYDDIHQVYVCTAIR